MSTHVSLVTPERVLHTGEANFVVLRSDGGEIMFLPNHADFVGAVDICVVRIAAVAAEGAETEPTEVRAAVAGGFVHVRDNSVTVLASVAELAEEIDVARARHALDTSEASFGAEGGGDRAAAAAPHGGAGGSDEDGIEQTQAGSTVLALLYPELAEVRARRARARLEAAGMLDASTTSMAAPSH